MSGEHVAEEKLRGWERWGLWGLLGVVVAFGALVELRSCFLQRRMGDLGVTLRAGWAVREGGQRLHTISDNNGWHYCYPPALAILLAPLGDPPPGETGDYVVPFPISVAFWYVLSFAALAWALHTLASVLDPNTPSGTRRWWVLRVVPFLVCLPPVGNTAGRGQVGLFLLALISSFLASTVRGRRFQAGLFLSAAICMKIIPAFLGIIPLFRRDFRCLAGCTVGLFLGLIVLPVAALGPTQTLRCYEELYDGVIAPGLGRGGNQNWAKELTNVTATGSQSFLAIIHNTIHLDRYTRPANASSEVRRWHWGLSTLMTLTTLWLFRRGPSRLTAAQEHVLMGGMLILCMMLSSPVCHIHYFCMTLPLVMALLAIHRGRRVYAPRSLSILFAICLVSYVLPMLPWLWILRDVGMVMFAGLLLWAMGVRTAVRARGHVRSQGEFPRLSRAA